MNSKSIKAIEQSLVNSICYKCLSKDKHLTKINISALGYGGHFDELDIHLCLCDDCLAESKKAIPEIWSEDIIIDEHKHTEVYVEDDRKWDYLNTLPIQCQELIFNRTVCDRWGSNKMDPQDYIDYELGELSHEKCHEYNLYSEEDKKSYNEQFPTCQHPVNILFDDGSKISKCVKRNISGSYGQIARGCDTGCYHCEHYIPRTTPIKDIPEALYDDYCNYLNAKDAEERLKDAKII